MMQQEGHLEIGRACELARVSRAGFYRQYAEQEPLQADLDVRGVIQKIVLENRCYGYRRVAAALRQQGWEVNHKRVLRLMRQDNLLCLLKRRFVLTTDSRHPYGVFPNLTAELRLNGINQLWVADITYIRLREAFLYLAAILDAFSRKVVGWALRETLEAEVALAALSRALADRPVAAGIIHHSDQGVQYSAKDYVAKLLASGFRISMSRRASPWENARAETFFKTLKQEEVSLRQYRDRNEAERLIGEFIEAVYNRKRLHSALGYQSPMASEAQISLGAATDSPRAGPL